MFLKKIKNLLPKKSIFGFEIINAKVSIVFAIFFIFLNFIINRFFGLNKLNMIAGNMFFLISNSSILILILNSYFREKIDNSSSLFIYRFLLLIYSPFGLFFIYQNIYQLISLFINTSDGLIN